MNPDELLAQIRDLLDQYLQLGAGTPVESEAQALAAAIDQTTGGGGSDMEGPADMASEPGGEPPMEDQMPMNSGQTPLPDMTGGMPLDQQQPGGYGSFKDANAALTEDIKKRIKAR